MIYRNGMLGVIRHSRVYRVVVRVKFDIDRGRNTPYVKLAPIPGISRCELRDNETPGNHLYPGCPQFRLRMHQFRVYFPEKHYILLRCHIAIPAILFHASHKQNCNTQQNCHPCQHSIIIHYNHLRMKYSKTEQYICYIPRCPNFGSASRRQKLINRTHFCEKPSLTHTI